MRFLVGCLPFLRMCVCVCVYMFESDVCSVACAFLPHFCSVASLNKPCFFSVCSFVALNSLRYLVRSGKADAFCSCLPCSFVCFVYDSEHSLFVSWLRYDSIVISPSLQTGLTNPNYGTRWHTQHTEQCRFSTRIYHQNRQLWTWTKNRNVFFSYPIQNES